MDEFVDRLVCDNGDKFVQRLKVRAYSCQRDSRVAAGRQFRPRSATAVPLFLVNSIEGCMETVTCDRGGAVKSPA